MKTPIKLSAVFVFLVFLAQSHAAELAPDVLRMMNAADHSDQIPVIIRFRDQLDVRTLGQGDVETRRSRIINALREKSLDTQARVMALLNARLGADGVQRIKHLWMINAIAAQLPAAVIDELSRRQDIDSITLDAKVTRTSEASAASYAPEWNLSTIGAQTLWGMGHQGQGVVVGVMDTGVDMLHQDLVGRWRGGAGGWFDPYGEHASPYDASGHGTQVTGIVVGGNNSGTAIGVAPGSQWIAAKIFNDSDSASLSAIHQGFQWMLDPDNDPATDDAPDIVNNSWNLQYSLNTCNTEFQGDIDVLRSADIAVVFSAGNTGPASASSLSPANNSGSLSTGGVDESLNVVYSSARGPSACGGGIYPLLSAPGFNIYTSDLTFGGALPDLYATVSGTSFASAHVAGAMALLKSAMANLTVDDIETALMQSAVDVGVSGADNDNGWGVIDVVAAYQLLQTLPTVPVAANDSYSMMANESLLVDAPGVLANDTASGPITARLYSPVSSGNLLLNSDGSFSYTPLAGYSGTVSFEYVANDGAQDSSPARVDISVMSVNQAPVANDDFATTSRKVAVVIDLLANDSDADSQIDVTSIVIVTAPARGEVSINGDGTVTYTPQRGSSDSFSYRVSDMQGAQSNLANVSVSILRR